MYVHMYINPAREKEKKKETNDKKKEGRKFKRIEEKKNDWKNSGKGYSCFFSSSPPQMSCN